MKLLIITQKVNKNDQVLGFFHRWIEEFAKNAEVVNVICLEKGDFNLPNNVKVFSLGKEEGVGKIGRLINFYKYIWKLRKEYDSVFVHMNQIYVLLGGVFWKILKKKISLWYAHGKVSLDLKISEKLVDYIFTSTSGGFRINSSKVKIIGQGIDTKLFKPTSVSKNKKQVITVGRISEVKNIDLIVKIISENPDFTLDIVGAPIRQKDFDYAKGIYLEVQKNNLSNRINFVGPVSQENLTEKYNNAHIFINLSKTGSLDKAILEAMACGLQVLTTNEAAKNLSGINFISRHLVNTDLNIFFDKLKELSSLNLNEEARRYVVENHSIESLIPKIVGFLK